MKTVLVFTLLVFAGSQARKRQNGKARVRNSQIKTQEGTCDLSVSCKPDNKFPINVPIRGPRGHKGDRGDRGPPGSSGTPGFPAVPEAKVAFFAGLDKNVGAVKDNAEIPFTSCLTNIGNAYNKDTGRFTAPVNGTYQFTAVISAQGGQKAAAMLVKNGAMIVTIWAESFPSWGTASNSVVLNLKANEQVWLVQLARAPFLHGYMYSTFSGMLLFSDS